MCVLFIRSVHGIFDRDWGTLIVAVSIFAYVHWYCWGLWLLYSSHPYKMKNGNTKPRLDPSNKELDELGSIGWELVHVVHEGSSRGVDRWFISNVQ